MKYYSDLGKQKLLLFSDYIINREIGNWNIYSKLGTALDNLLKRKISQTLLTNKLKNIKRLIHTLQSVFKFLYC